jgi:hypothetical protein
VSSDLDAYAARTIEQLLICRNCQNPPTRHVGEKCLFDSTVWDPMSLEEWEAWSNAEFERCIDGVVRRAWKEGL